MVGPVVNFVETLEACLDFEAVSTRAQFWWYALISVALLSMIAWIPFIGTPMLFLCSLITFLPSLAISIRRLRDAGFSPWLVLMGVIPIVGMALVVLWVFPSQDLNAQSSEPKDWRESIFE